MLITKTVEIDMGHRVPNHESKCRNIHGHRYKIEVGVDDQVILTPGAPDEGMVIDFADLKKSIEVVTELYDHSLVLYENDPLASPLDDLLMGLKFWMINSIPTAENLAKHWFEMLDPILQKQNISLRFIKVWETPTSTATYERSSI